MEPFELQGLWWLLDHEDHQVPGVLAWDPDKGGTLRLVGQLHPIVLLDNHLTSGGVQKYRDRTYDEDTSYPVILGLVEQELWTLLNAFQLSRRDWSLEMSSETVHVNAAVQGACFDGPDIEVDSTAFRMRDFAGWVDVSGVETTFPRLDRDGDEFAVVTGRTLPDVEVRAAGPRVVLAQRLETKSSSIESAGIDQDWILRVTQEQVTSLQSFVDVASDVQDLVSIATGRTAEFRRVALHHPDVPLRNLAGQPLGRSRQDLLYHAVWTNRVEYEAEGSDAREPLSSVKMYFTLTDLGIEGLGRWLEAVVDYRTELGRVMATRYGGGFLEDRIMNVCAALESFDKQRRQTGKKKVDYVDRINECVELAGGIFRELIVEDPGEWAKSVKNLRHDLAHHRERFRVEGSVGEHLVSEQLFWLFAVCMLRVAQAPEVVFERTARHPRWGWLQQKAADASAAP